MKADKFIELTNRINDMTLDIVNLNDKLEKTLERIENQKATLCDNGVDYDMEEDVINFIEINNYEKYTDKFKYIGIKKLEDFLILNTYELNENGILYVDAKKIIESAKEAVETSEIMV